MQSHLLFYNYKFAIVGEKFTKSGWGFVSRDPLMQTYLQATAQRVVLLQVFFSPDNCLVWHWHSSWQGVPA